MIAKAQGFTNDKKPSPRRIKKMRENTRKMIAESGRAIIAVMGREDECPLFAYSLGNHVTQDTAEAISFDLSPKRTRD